MKGLPLQITVAWLVSLGVGCSSAPVRYYTLTPPPAETLPAAATNLAIDVRVVHAPPQLNRSELMIRTGPAAVTLLENERWAAPLNDEIKDALRLELRRRLSRVSGSLGVFTKLTVDIDVQHFEAQFGHDALFEASWNAALSSAGQRSTGVPATACTFKADEKITAGYAEIVEGYQRAIAALADAIVAVLTSPSSAENAACHYSPMRS
jgi:uncharacterized lipoprotein YmbA